MRKKKRSCGFIFLGEKPPCGDFPIDYHPLIREMTEIIKLVAASPA